MTQENINYLDLDSLITERPRITLHDGTAIVLRDISTDDAMQMFSRAKEVSSLPPGKSIPAMVRILLDIAEEPESAVAIINRMPVVDIWRAYQWLFSMETAEYKVEPPEVTGKVKLNGREYDVLPLTYGVFTITNRVAEGIGEDGQPLTEAQQYELGTEAIAMTIGSTIEEIRALNYVCRNRLDRFIEQQAEEAVRKMLDTKQGNASRGRGKDGR